MPPDSSPPRAAPGTPLVVASVATVLLGSALLFIVQPLMGRLVLPRAGGAPAVWTTCVMFFQAALLAGYAYAHASSRWLSLRAQKILHVLLLASAIVVLPIDARPAWELPDPAHPTPWLLSVLVRSVGIPFVIVAATAPLVQRWFAATRHPRASEPYFLYAASNVGSLAGLLAYPLAIEPAWTLSRQGRAWTIGYAVFVASSLAVLAMAHDSRVETPFSNPARDREAPPTSATGAMRLRWLGLAFLPSLLMLAVTTHISTDIAAVPLLWIGPLTVYLATLILTFARRPPIPHALVTAMLPAAVIPAALLLAGWPVSPLVAIPIHLLALFVAGMMSHGELARARPAAGNLTAYYLWIAAGGVAGGVAASLIAPLVFPTPLEYPIGLVLSCVCRPRARHSSNRAIDVGVPAAVAVLLVLQMVVARQVGLPSSGPMTVAFVFGPAVVAALALWMRPRPFAAAMAIVLAGASGWHRLTTRIEHVERNFFGVQSIELSSRGGFRALVHGNTIHGTQALDPALRHTPTSYYTRTGPAGQALSGTPAALAGTRKNVAVVGLGAGTLAAYVSAGERWTFYEINPAVERLAKDPRYFTYLSDCGPACEVVLGDARLEIARAPAGRYDLIALDAFSSDAIPVHLLTREALGVYLRALAPHGVLLIHLSNRFLDLRPIVAALAADAGLYAIGSADAGSRASREPGRIDSVWALVGRAKDDLGALAHDAEWTRLVPMTGLRVWTDDYSNIFTVLRARLPGQP